MLAFPFKEADQVLFSSALSSYISNEYSEDPQVYAADLLALDRLRCSISVPQVHDESALDHLRYYWQLCCIENKFKIDEDNVLDIQVGSHCIYMEQLYGKPRVFVVFQYGF